MQTKNIEKQPFKGEINLSGVNIKWSSSKRLRQDETGDWDCVGGDSITISATKPVSAQEIRQALSRVDLLEKARKCESRLSCPYTDAQIAITGLDETGHLLVQIIRDGAPRGHGPAWNFANLIPEDYSSSGEIAMRSIAFIRDASRIISRSENVSVRDIETALFNLRP